MYKIVYAKTALKDIPKLKSAHLDEKAKALISVIKKKKIRSRTRRPMKSWWAI